MASKQRKPDSIIREGDRVVVRVPRFVARVGYPKTVEDYLPEVREKHGAELDALFFAVTGDTHRFSYRLSKPTEPTKQRARVERELAYLLAKNSHFGGTERSIHWLEKPEFTGVEVLVVEVRTAYTGSYFPPSGSWTGSIFDDCDYEPGGLNKMKCHRIARVRLERPVSRFDVLYTGFLQEGTVGRKLGLEIPVYHLEKVGAEEARAA